MRKSKIKRVHSFAKELCRVIYKRFYKLNKAKEMTMQRMFIIQTFVLKNDKLSSKINYLVVNQKQQFYSIKN